MNKVKTAVLGLSLVVGSFAFSQEGKSELTKEQRMEERSDKQIEELGLSEDQRVQFMELRKSSMETKQKIKNDESLDHESKKVALKELHKESKAKMAEFLTEDQLAKLKDMKKERHENHKKSQHGKKHKGEHKEMKKVNKVPAQRLEKAPVNN